jgi:hypothetical protein
VLKIAFSCAAVQDVFANGNDNSARQSEELCGRASEVRFGVPAHRRRYLVQAWRYISSSTLVKATEATAAQSIDPEYIRRAIGIPYEALTGAAAALS